MVWTSENLLFGEGSSLSRVLFRQVLLYKMNDTQYAYMYTEQL